MDSIWWIKKSSASNTWCIYLQWHRPKSNPLFLSQHRFFHHCAHNSLDGLVPRDSPHTELKRICLVSYQTSRMWYRNNREATIDLTQRFTSLCIVSELCDHVIITTGSKLSNFIWNFTSDTLPVCMSSYTGTSHL